MSKELTVFTSNDLVSAGINTQLTSNDLVEVVAHDIYDKYLDSINNVIEAGGKLQTKYSKLLDVEINKMKYALSKYLRKDEVIEIVEEDDYSGEEFEGVSASFSSAENYWSSISISEIVVKEKERGSFVEKGYRNLSFPVLKDKNTKVRITLQTGKKNNNEDVKVGNITGEIATSTQKTFKQVITLPIARFKSLSEEIKEYNKQVCDLMAFLPKNGQLSVERFTREARVKMNKKIISAQSPDFRKKISELFNIKL